MSNTPSKKKQPVKPVEQKAKYAIGQRVFFIDQRRSKTGEIIQGQVIASNLYKTRIKGEVGKPYETTIDFEYDLFTSYGEYYGVSEYDLFPTFNAVAIEFANQFTHLLK